MRPFLMIDFGGWKREIARYCLDVNAMLVVNNPMVEDGIDLFRVITHLAQRIILVFAVATCL